jgi:hypothetical protein
MNSVLQQLFMIRPLRTALLSVKIPPEYCNDEMDDDDVRRDNVCRIYFQTRKIYFILFSSIHVLTQKHFLKIINPQYHRQKILSLIEKNIIFKYSAKFKKCSGIY